MKNARIIPILLLSNNGLVKTQKFKDPVYIGDPINAVRIFNDKEVDELVLLDINVSRENKKPNFRFLQSIVCEAFMPIGYGGGIRTLEDAKNAFNMGIEKVIINSALYDSFNTIQQIIESYGSQSVIACVDYKKNLWGKTCPCFYGGTKMLKTDLLSYISSLVELGVGELILQSIDRDGTFGGYDLETISKLSRSVEIPVVAAGGAANHADFKAVIGNGASAAAAGSMFVFNGKHRAVLISYNNKFNEI